MKIYYSKKEVGFFNTNIHAKSEIPDDAVEITEQYYYELLNGNYSGKNIVADSNGYPQLVTPVIDFFTLKQNKIQEINVAAQKDADALIVAYPEFEKLSWPTQQQEAVLWFNTEDDKKQASLVPWCASAASIRNIDLAAFMLLVKNNIDAFVNASAAIAGCRQKIVSQIYALVDDTKENRDALNVITWEGVNTNV